MMEKEIKEVMQLIANGTKPSHAITIIAKHNNISPSYLAKEMSNRRSIKRKKHNNQLEFKF